VFLWFLLAILVLVICLVLLVQVGSVQNFLKDKAVTYLHDKLGTKISIGHVSIVYPKDISISDVFLADQRGDTLLYAHLLEANVDLPALIHGQVKVRSLNLDRLKATIKRDPRDSTFNFSYILKSFASKTPEPKKVDTSSLQISLGDIDLARISLHYDDRLTGYRAGVYFGRLVTHIDKFDLKQMHFGIRSFILSDLNTSVDQLAAPGPMRRMSLADSVAAAKAAQREAALARADSAHGIQVTLQSGELRRDKIRFTSASQKLDTRFDLGALDLSQARLDLGRQRVTLAALSLKDTRSQVRFIRSVLKQTSPAVAAATQASDPVASDGWKVDVVKLDLEGDAVQYDNDNMRPVKAGMDYNHLDLEGLSLETHKLHYEPTVSHLLLDKLGLREKCGFQVRAGSGDLYYASKKTAVKNLAISTAESDLKANAELEYPSLDALSKKPGELKLSIDVAPSTLGLKDVLYFQPGLAATDPFKKSPATKIRLNARASGYLKDLTVQKLEASALGETHILASGRIKGLPDPASLYMDLDLKDFRTSSANINSLVSKGVVPVSVHLPARIQATSKIKGSLANFVYNFNIGSNLGNVVAAGYLKMGPKGRDTAYKIDLTARRVQAGVLSGQPKTLGIIDANLNAEGKGLSLKTANTQFRARIINALFKGYNYSGLAIAGGVAGRQANLTGGIKDRNLSFHLNGSADLRKKAPSFKLALNLDSADFKALHFSTTALKLHADLLADLPSADFNHPEGSVDITHFLMVTDSASIPLDTLALTAHTEGVRKSFRLKSEFLKAALDGEISLPDIGDQLTNQFNRYYRFTTPTKRTHFPPADFTFKAQLLGPPSLHKLIPKLASFTPVQMEGRFMSATNTFQFNAGAPRTQYSDITVDSLRINLRGDSSRLNYQLSVDSISASGFDLQSTRLSGFAANNQLHVGLAINDEKKRVKYALETLLSEARGVYQFKFLPRGLVLNYDPWTVTGDNLLEYNANGIHAQDIKLTHSGSVISISSTGPKFNSPVKINFDHFDLATLSKLIEKDTVLVRGTLNGTALADKLLTSPVFTSDLVLKDFSFRKDTLGDVSLKVNNTTAGAYKAQVGISGKGNQALLDGFYYTKGSNFKFSLAIDRLNLASVEAYSFGQIRQAKGYLNGKFDISGTATSPLVIGNIGFRNVGFNLNYINSFLTIPSQQINFDSKGIHFNDFLLLDSAKNQLDIDGDILTPNYQKYTFDLTVSSTDFRILNTTVKDNPNYYGKVYLNSDIDITGNLSKPVIDANITLNKRTTFTYVVPSDDPSLEERKGIVEFVSHKDSALAKPKKTAKNNAYQGFDFSANLGIDKDASFTVIIDQQTGDALKVKGEGTLNTTIDPSGKISLTGRYEIGEGSYQLTVNNFIKKTFSIKKGSTITWTGEPTMADVDLTAVYIANAPSIDLMEQQVSDPAAATKYKQKLPFNLNLIMKGELLKPAITFSIDLPEKEANLNVEVKARLDQLKQDPNELNKQVFALLLLNRFVGQNPLQSQSGGGLNAGLVARQSAGKLLSQQLNSLAGSLVKGVDLNFNLNSQDNYTTGTQQTRTDLQVGATKNFNDRLSVSVGTDINLEGSQTTNPNATGLIGDVNVEYRLSRDGRYRLRAFRRNATEEFVEGQFIETGVSFLFVVDYNKFKDAFKTTETVGPKVLKSRKQATRDSIGVGK